MNSNRIRLTYLSYATAIIAVGLAVHFHGGFLPPAARDFIGDALWGSMVASIISATIPKSASGTRYVVALIVCFSVEFSQLYHAPALDHLRATTLGALVLGSGFDVRDLTAYALGVLLFALVDLRWLAGNKLNPS